MIEQKIIFGCNHVISALKRESVLCVILRDSEGLTDVITRSANVADVFYVYQLSDAPNSTVNYKKDIDYTISENEITWISEHRPANGTLYQCEIMQNRRTISDYSNNPRQCERCYGQGWYVDAMSASYQRVDNVMGTNKLVQDYIKVIYTLKQEDGYGTNLLNLVGQQIYDENLYLSEIGSELTSGALQIQQMQAALLAEDETALSDDEILMQLEIISMEYDQEESNAYVEIRLITRATNSSAMVGFQF